MAGTVKLPAIAVMAGLNVPVTVKLPGIVTVWSVLPMVIPSAVVVPMLRVPAAAVSMP